MSHKTIAINTHCNNCGTMLAGKHCHECGQKAQIGRLTLHDLFHEVWHALTHTDKGIVKLIADLAVRPQKVYHNYFNGQRKKYFSPVIFFLVTAGILVFSYEKVFDYEDKITGLKNEFLRLAYHITKYRALVLLPIQVIVTWLIYRRKLNIAETTVFWLFCLGFTFTVKIVLTPLYFPLIYYKPVIDNVFFLLSYFIIFVHGVQATGNWSIKQVVIWLILANVFIIADGLVEYYLLWGDFDFAENMGAGSFKDLIKEIYSW